MTELELKKWKILNTLEILQSYINGMTMDIERGLEEGGNTYVQSIMDGLESEVKLAQGRLKKLL